MRRLALVAAAVFAFAACSSTAGEEDAPVGERHEAPREIWVMSDEYPNLSGVCIGSDLVLVTRQGSRSPVVLPDNEECAG